MKFKATIEYAGGGTEIHAVEAKYLEEATDLILYGGVIRPGVGYQLKVEPVSRTGMSVPVNLNREGLYSGRMGATPIAPSSPPEPNKDILR